jgi:hypothetical protein
MLYQEDVRVYLPFTGEAQDKSETGRFAFLYDLTNDPYENVELLTKFEGREIGDVVLHLATTLCSSYSNSMASVRIALSIPIAHICCTKNALEFYRFDTECNRALLDGHSKITRTLSPTGWATPMSSKDIISKHAQVLEKYLLKIVVSLQV